MSTKLWTKEAVVVAILGEAHSGQDLSYSTIQKVLPSLLRAAQRAFGSWSNAIEAAGLDYDAIRKYKLWTREKVIERIKELHQSGADLCWFNISTNLDPALAAATLHAGRFASWQEALSAAGIDPVSVYRYHKWTKSEIQKQLAELAKNDIPLDQLSILHVSPSLLAAIYRHGSRLSAEREYAEKNRFSACI